ncbi:acyl-CoA dehydrogenase [Solibacillus sp. CAU 1738]|uniref:acyl-CoA dehydrogenase n=1 Tax=Solibacillus sp. CAU 1738 TaxID=3140363 RepID=UPI0032600426
MSRFTYDKFEQDGIFTLLDPVFTTIAVFSVLFCIAVFLLKPSAKLVLFVGSFTIIITVQLFWLSGILIDELALSGGSKDFILLIVTAIAQVIAIVAGYFFENKGKK